MEPMQIALIVLVLAGAWAVVELALTLRRTRGVVDSLDKTVSQLNGTLEEARPMVAKLDAAIDELQPAMAQIEPLLKQTNVAVEALSADLIEVNGVLRDVSTVSGAAASTSNAVTGLADAASEKVQKFFGKGAKSAPVDGSRTLEEASGSSTLDELDLDEPLAHDEPASEPQQPQQYYTYGQTEESSHE